MAERRATQRSQAVLREKLEKWRKQKQQTVGVNTNPRNVKVKESVSSKQNRDAKQLRLPLKRNGKAWESTKNPPCTCKAKENVNKSRTPKGNLQRVSESIQAASQRRDNKLKIINQRDKTSDKVTSRRSCPPKPTEWLKDFKEDVGTSREGPKPWDNKQMGIRKRLELWKTEKRNNICAATPKQAAKKPRHKRASPTSLGLEANQKLSRKPEHRSVLSSPARTQENEQKQISTNSNKDETQATKVPLTELDATEWNKNNKETQSSYFPVNTTGVTLVTMAKCSDDQISSAEQHQSMTIEAEESSTAECVEQDHTALTTTPATVATVRSYTRQIPRSVEQHQSMSNMEEEESSTAESMEHDHTLTTTPATVTTGRSYRQTSSAVQQHQNTTVDEEESSTAESVEQDHTALTTTPATVRSYRNKSLSIRERLDLWRQENGKTPKFPKIPSTVKRARHVSHVTTDPVIDVCNAKTARIYQEIPGLEEFETMACDVAEEETASEALREKLKECYRRLQNDDCCDDEVAAQLDQIHKSHASALLCAEFWVCRAKIAEHQGDSARMVCFFEQALVFRAEPEALIRDAVSEYAAKRKQSEQAEQVPDTGTEEEDIETAPSLEDSLPPDTDPKTPRRTTNHQNAFTEEPSSVVKYSVTKATPFKTRLQSCERSIVTPVRRSARLERRSIHYPTMLQEHGLILRNLEGLPEDARQHVVFKPNFAVENDLNEAWREMWEVDF